MLAFNQNEFYISAMLSNKLSTKVHNGNNEKQSTKKHNF